MKSLVLGWVSLVLVSTCAPPTPHGSALPEVFVATSPCDDVSRRLLQIPAADKCEMIKWNLTLYLDAATLTPASYTLQFIYGLPQPGTNGLVNGGRRLE